jgi:thioredoxin-related protein
LLWFVKHAASTHFHGGTPLRYIAIIFIAILLATKSVFCLSQAPITKPIVGYWAGPVPITHRDAQLMKSGGWNLVWVTKRGSKGQGTLIDYLLEQLDLVGEYGLDAIVNLGRMVHRDDAVPPFINKKNQLNIAQAIQAIHHHKSLFAYHLIDEPSANVFKKLRKVKNYILEIDRKHLVYVNLYPNYAKQSKFGNYGKRLITYEEYLQQFIDTVKPQLLSYDHYAININGINGDQFLSNLQTVSSVSAENDLPFIIILQASGWGLWKKIPDIDELKWQVFTSLAFGAKGILWYVYAYPNHRGTLVTLEKVMKRQDKRGFKIIAGDPSERFWSVAAINKQFFNIAKEIIDKKVLHVDGLNNTLDRKVGSKKSTVKLTDSQGTPVTSLGYSDCLVSFLGNEKKVTHILVVNQNTDDVIQKRYRNCLDSNLNHILSQTMPGVLRFYPESATWRQMSLSDSQLRLKGGDGVLLKTGKN